MKVRLATAADIPSLMALEQDAVTAAHWSQERYDAIFFGAGPRRLPLVVEEQGQIQGFLVGSGVDKDWEIENMAVAESARRYGLGSILVSKFLEIIRARGAEAAYLEVRESNRAARALYEKWGFRETGRRKQYYHQPTESAILYHIKFH